MNDTIENVNCPACGKLMQKVYIERTGFALDVCTDGCGGIFFDGRELEYFDENHESIDEIVEALKNKTFIDTDQTLTRTCPVCANNMVKNFVSVKKKIQIDECYNCGSKFFDRGELTAMRNEYATEEDRRQDFLSSVYNEFGAQIDEMDLQNKINYSNRSAFLKILDRFFLG